MKANVNKAMILVMLFGIVICDITITFNGENLEVAPSYKSRAFNLNTVIIKKSYVKKHVVGGMESSLFYGKKCRKIEMCNWKLGKLSFLISV